MGAADFRVGGRIFATLASQAEGYGNLMLTPEVQTMFITDAPTLFLPIAGGWGRMGMTHIRLAKADEATLRGALTQAWKLRLEKNGRAQSRRRRCPLGTRRGSSGGRGARRSVPTWPAPCRH